MPANVFELVLNGLLVIGSGAVILAVRRMFSSKEEKQSAMADISDMGTKDSSPFAKLENSPNPLDKLYFFLGRTLKQETPLQTTFIQLGSPSKTDPLKMLQAKTRFAFFFAVAFGIIIGLPGFLFGALVGYLIPSTSWSREITRRQKEILRNFPTFVDLAALMIESGLDYMTAFDRIVKISSEKSGWEVEVEKTINEVQLGYSRRDALHRMADRIGLQEVRSFVSLVIQSDELGTSLVELLRNYSADMRFRRLNKAEKLAAQASTKMLIPMFVFIFPTVFVLMLAPVIMDLFQGGMPF